ncbi:hypothetical protein IJ674_07150 [bacterium]|jgi:glutathionyl-hydroquinone reductase|nr:hypothetical protein [bacterium]
MSLFTYGVKLLGAKVSYFRTKVLASVATKTAQHGLVRNQSAKAVRKIKDSYNAFTQSHSGSVVPSDCYNKWDVGTLTGYLNSGAHTKEYHEALKAFEKIDKKTMDTMLRPYLADSKLLWGDSTQYNNIRKGIFELYAKRGNLKDIKYLQKYLSDPQYKTQAQKAIDGILQNAKKYSDKDYVKAQDWISKNGGISCGNFEQFRAANPRYVEKFVS